MAVTITKIDDKSDGFTVEFEVRAQFKQTFDTRPLGMDQMSYARERVQTVVPTKVENPAGVFVVPTAPVQVIPETIQDITPLPDIPIEGTTDPPILNSNAETIPQTPAIELTDPPDIPPTRLSRRR